jgi:hypothetical protein
MSNKKSPSSDEARESLGGLFEVPVPRHQNGEVDVFSLVFAEGPCEGKRFGDCTKQDIEQLIKYADAGGHVHELLCRLLNRAP